jgi:hypothetical protein
MTPIVCNGRPSFAALARRLKSLSATRADGKGSGLWDPCFDTTDDAEYGRLSAVNREVLNQASSSWTRCSNSRASSSTAGGCRGSCFNRLIERKWGRITRLNWSLIVEGPITDNIAETNWRYTCRYKPKRVYVTPPIRSDLVLISKRGLQVGKSRARVTVTNIQRDFVNQFLLIVSIVSHFMSTLLF